MFNEQRPVQILELFGGIGSPRCALRNLGIPTKAIDYVEIDEKAVRSYNSMFAEELPYKTQSVVGWNLKPDILIHGSPCQDMSIAGHQGKAKAEDGRINRGKGADQGSGTRSSLMWETIHIIEQMGKWKPKYVIWENVRNVTSRHMIANFIRYQKEMERIPMSRSQCNKRYNKAIEMLLNKGRIERMIEENEEAYTDWKLDKEWKMLKKSPEKQSGGIESGNKSGKYFQENQKVKAVSNADRIDRRKKKGMKTQRT